MEFDSLRDLLYAPDPSSTDAVSTSHDHAGSASIPQLAPELHDVDYDQHVRELVYEKRAKPKDRTKTEEELALEEKEALEKAERRRRKRMLGLEESESEDEGNSRRKRKRGGDDLEDDFDGPELSGLGPGLDEGEKVEQASEGEERDCGESSEDDDDEGDDPESTDGPDISEAEDGDQEELVQSRKVGERRLSSPKPSKELPFTFSCPSSHAEFLDIIDDVEDQDVPTVVHRIRALHHTSLAPENKFKLQVSMRFASLATF